MILRMEDIETLKITMRKMMKENLKMMKISMVKKVNQLMKRMMK
jgi:hypothetical protein